jgi:hypothetical protein
MVEEVSDEMHAIMAVKLAGDVRELIRKEIKEAFNDTSFVYDICYNNLLVSILGTQLVNDYTFRGQITAILKEVLNDPSTQQGVIEAIQRRIRFHTTINTGGY